MTIKIGETHTVFPCAALDPLSDRDAMIRSEVLATEAVKRLVEALKEIETTAEFFVQDGVSSNALRGGHFQILGKARAALAPFTDTEEADNG